MPINLKTHIQMQSRIIDNKLPRLQDNIEEEVNQLWAVKLNILFMIFDIVMGILLIKKKTTKMAYILAITELVYIVLVSIQRNRKKF